MFILKLCIMLISWSLDVNINKKICFGSEENKENEQMVVIAENEIGEIVDADSSIETTSSNEDNDEPKEANSFVDSFNHIHGVQEDLCHWDKKDDTSVLSPIVNTPNPVDNDKSSELIKCETCDITFKHDRALKHHIKVIHGKHFACDECDE